MSQAAFKYVFDGDGPIDYFYGTMSKDELINSEAVFIENDEHGRAFFARQVEDMNGFIHGWVLKDSGEEPNVVRFFAVPHYDGLETQICALAKISNNGQTYMFTNDDRFYRLYADE